VAIGDCAFAMLFRSSIHQLNGYPQLWLGIEVGTDAEMSPRVQLGSAAYAMQALTVPDGSIGTAKLADNVITTTKLMDASVTGAKLANGAVLSEKLKLQNGTTCLSDRYTVSLAGAGEGKLVPGLTQNFSLTRPSKVLVWMDGLASFSQASNGWAHVYLFVDTVLQTMSASYDTDDTWFLVKGQRIIDLGAGAHSITVGVQSGNSGTFSIEGSNSGKSCISTRR
jgi:hypothetical protein